MLGAADSKGYANTKRVSSREIRHPTETNSNTLLLPIVTGDIVKWWHGWDGNVDAVIRWHGHMAAW